MKNIIIAVDGYSSCGKSTLSKDLAKKLKYNYIDSGAMYRVVALYCIQKGVDVEVEKDVVNLLPKIKISFRYNDAIEKSEAYLNNMNVEEEIRGMEVSSKVSFVSRYKAVRAALVAMQQEMGKDKGIVMDGRDIGTVVFPKAELKLFVTADFETRVNRRYKELIRKGIQVERSEIAKNLAERDSIDVSRDESPLRKADDARELDNTFLSMEEQLNLAYYFALEKMKN